MSESQLSRQSPMTLPHGVPSLKVRGVVGVTNGMWQSEDYKRLQLLS